VLDYITELYSETELVIQDQMSGLKSFPNQFCLEKFEGLANQTSNRTINKQEDPYIYYLERHAKIPNSEESLS
jgi:hypothetical protein